MKASCGGADEGIIEAADEVKVDLIAMSTHGRSVISRWAVGSVTDRVLRSGDRPIFMVRAPREAART